jgi:hypothetical protein
MSNYRPWSRPKGGKSSIRVALPIVKGHVLEPMTKKRDEAGTVIDLDVDAGIASSDIRPRHDLVKVMIVYGLPSIGSRLEERDERLQDAGGEERKQQNYSAGKGKPTGRKTAKKKNQKLVSGDCQPVNGDVQAVRCGAPLGYLEERMENDQDDRSSQKEKS